MKRATIFPGQGAQRPGMGRDLCEAFPEAAELFRRADDVLGFPLSETCFSGTPETVNRTDVCQPGIFLVSAATMTVLARRSGLPSTEFVAAAGLSLGEYTALWFAGALGFEDGLRLTRVRGELMQRASDARPSGMSSVLGLDREAVEEALSGLDDELGPICVANLNCPGQVVISGTTEALRAAVEPLAEAGARRVKPLSVAGAFHSPLMASASDGLAKSLAEVEVKQPAIPVVCNASAEPTTDPGVIRESLVRQLVSPVLWERSVRRLLSLGVEEFVEPGPGTVLAGLMRKIDRSVSVAGYPSAASIQEGL